MEGVRAGFGDGVEQRTRETGAAHIVGRELDAERLDRLERDRAAERGEAVAVEAKRVDRLHSVDEERVEAEVLALRAQIAALVQRHQCEPRIERRDVLDVTADSGDLADLHAVVARAGADLAGAESEVALGSDIERLKFHYFRREREGEFLRGAEIEKDIGACFGAIRAR